MPDLPRAGREYLTVTLADAPDDVELEVSFDRGTTWHATDRDGDTARILVAGPTAEGEGAVALPLGRSHVHVRAVDNPEIVIRNGGAIDVT